VAQGRLAEAEEWLQQVLDEYPDDIEADNDLGFLWADENTHLQRASKMIAVAIAAEPKNRAYRDSLGWVYYRKGRFAEAVVELEKAVDEKQPDATVLDHLGDAYEKLGRHDKALAAWQRAVAAYEKDKEREKAGKVAEKLKKTR
jgi:tetratricopeptide (TPR) repeat protein